MDLGAVRANVGTLRGLLPAATRLIAVVKADGYGHGARPIGRSALAAGAWGLAVVTLAEAHEVRDLVAPERILVMGPVLPADAAEAVAGGYAVGCSTVALAKTLELAAGDRRVPVHLKLDTGMGRYGAQPAEFEEMVRLVRGSGRLELAGIWSHLASSDSDPAFTRTQHDRFMAVTEGLPGIRHLANSGGVLAHPEMALDAVRVGIALYGCGDARVRPVLALRARVAHLKSVDTGTPIGYGTTWRAPAPSRIATLAIGYADGIHRARSGRGEILLHGRRVPLVGLVSMDSITVDATALPEVEVGDAGTLIGTDGEETIRAEEVAAWSDTISYEVLTSIGRRVERVYHASD